MAASVAAAVQPEELTFCPYRGHTHTLVRGADMAGLMAEALERGTGICGRRGGSMHLTDVKVGAMGSYAYVGAHLPIATGPGWRPSKEDPRLCGWGAELTSITTEEAFYDLNGPTIRITTPHIPLLSADPFEDLAKPSEERIADRLTQLGLGSGVR